MLRLDYETSLLIARCDRALDGSVTLRLHVRVDGGADAGEYIIEVPAGNCDGESGDAFMEFGPAVHDAYRKARRAHELLEIGYADGNESERQAAIDAIDDGFSRLLALAKKAKVRRALEGGPRPPNRGARG
jgi:hypothetical protein